MWSSAQPHSVDDMVKRCFDAEDDDEGGRRGGGGGGGGGGGDADLYAGAEEDVVAKKRGRDNLVAIWARDTLGLTDGEYRKSLPFHLPRSILSILSSFYFSTSFYSPYYSSHPAYAFCPIYLHNASISH